MAWGVDPAVFLLHIVRVGPLASAVSRDLEKKHETAAAWLTNYHRTCLLKTF